MSIATSLRRARLNSGVSLRHTATAAGVGASSLSNIESGRREPTSGTVERIAETLGVRVAVIPRVDRLTAADAAETIATYAGAEPATAYRAFLQLADDLAGADPYEQFLLTVEQPRRLGNRWDDAIAALVELRLPKSSVPPWAAKHNTAPGEPVWEPQRTPFPLPALTDLSEAPEPFRRRGVAISAGELESV
ncbi:helix-turn-helix domain-containing protein [Microbacterium sp. YMB-B2]|uniref:Helix-turn-helix domain-containing protein n=1 Tax=Microbacterium tenebrionis TaxID=2830665 RepID=A0A9X1S0C7_9MICO|nr:helix-turn-helix transcriptional regulator [Microbacterium tenebrionis]MCC2029669.1 helix-turn-helix domain-containing protein [Microbacterium tenebrionis]